MSLKIGVPAETHPGERRIPVVPDVVKKYQGLGAHVVMQSGAGVPAHYRDDAFAEVSVVDDAQSVFGEAEVVLCVQPPSTESIAAMKPG
ncbi:MAG: NAD(P)(+) transhydrogenase (Re/Si-specific) subunit alpha, partial [Azoarcus sp.]|nr:NAD(P)(+) transhydrogenase (Re/Si-specific) subunit alpha [Azoarcus sp.]